MYIFHIWQHDIKLYNHHYQHIHLCQLRRFRRRIRHRIRRIHHRIRRIHHRIRRYHRHHRIRHHNIIYVSQRVLKNMLFIWYNIIVQINFQFR